MYTLLSIGRGESFWGKQYFDSPKLFEEAGIVPESFLVSEFTTEEFDRVVETYPEQDIDAVLVHKVNAAREIVDMGLYEDASLFIAGHTALGVKQLEVLREVLDSGRQVYLFTGSIRAARSFYVAGYENLQIVVAPIMGRSCREEARLPQNFKKEPNKTHDIGFFSVITRKKRPHRVLETANAVAEELGETLDVWIAGSNPIHETAYPKLFIELVESSHYDNIDVEYHGHMRYPELFDTVQKTRLMYLPAVKKSETNSYAAWETVCFDIPLVGSDWAGIGEAIQHARHPDSRKVPVTTLNQFKSIFPDSVKEAHPEMVEETVSEVNPMKPHVMIDEEAAQHALIEGLTGDSSHTREFKIPERMRPETTIKSFVDILNGDLITVRDMPGGMRKHPERDKDNMVTSSDCDVLHTSHGYSILRDPVYRTPSLHLTSSCPPHSDNS